MSAPARSIEETAMSTSRVSITCSIGSRWTSTSNIDCSIVSGFSPCDIVRFPCGSRSIEQHAIALLGERDAEVERRRRLRDAALLVREDDHLRFGRRRHARRANVGTRKEARETHLTRHFGSVYCIPSVSSRSFCAAARPARRPRPAPRPRPRERAPQLVEHRRRPRRPQPLDPLEAPKHRVRLVHAPTVAGALSRVCSSSAK